MDDAMIKDGKAYRIYRLYRTDFVGVYYRILKNSMGKQEKFYYIQYYRDGKRHLEKAGGEFKDGMDADKAYVLRKAKQDGHVPPNMERRVAAAAQKEAAKEAKKAAVAARWTFDKLWEEYQKVKDGKSIKNDNNRYLTHLKEPFGNKTPREVVPLDVDRLRINLQKEKYAADTIASVLSLFRRIASFGFKRRLCPGLNFKVELPKNLKQRTEDMTPKMMQNYIKVCREWKDPQAGNFQLFALYTGMRRGEIQKLKWTDVDFNRGFIAIRDPKGGADQRIPLNDAAKALLESHPRTSTPRPNSKKGPKTGDFVFLGERGGQRGIKQISEASAEIRDAAGLPKDFRPNHGLRHTFASHLASSGEVDLYTLQKLMTHKSPMMTQRYAHLRDEPLKRGSNVMSRIIKDAK